MLPTGAVQRAGRGAGAGARGGLAGAARGTAGFCSGEGPSLASVAGVGTGGDVELLGFTGVAGLLVGNAAVELLTTAEAGAGGLATVGRDGSCCATARVTGFGASGS